MRNNLLDEMPRMLKYPWLFVHQPPLYEVLSDYANASQSSEINPVYKKSGTSARHDIPDELFNEALELLQLKGCIKLHCPSNAFITEFYKMIYERKVEGKPWLQ